MRPHDVTSKLFVNPNAQVDIVICNRQSLIKAMYRTEVISFHHAACCRDGRVIDALDESAKVAKISTGEANLNMPSSPAEAEHDTCMLNGLSGIVQLCSHDADSIQLRERHHSGHPRWADDFSIVVEEQQVTTGSFLSSYIVNPREVERNVNLFHTETITKLLGKTLIQILHMRVVAAVISNDDLIIGVVRLVKN